MNVLARKSVLVGLTMTVFSGLATGCIDLQGALQTAIETDLSSDVAASDSASDDVQASVATDLIPDSTTSSSDSQTASTGASQSTLTSTELQLLESVLTGLVTGSSTDSTSDASSSTSLLSDLVNLDLSRREIAVWVLDLVAQQADLTTEQSFALRLTSAILSGDADAQEQLLVEELLPTLIDAVSTTDN